MLKKVNKSFNGKKVIDQYDLKIEAGEFVSIVGASGSGKTTLLNLIGMLIKADSGDVVINNIVNPKGKDVLRLRRESIGYIFQNFVLMENETVKNNLMISKKYNPDFNEDLVNHALRTVGLDKTYLEKKIYLLSGGEQQRIAIARVMLKKYDIILADEATGNLDKSNKLIVIELLKNLSDLGKTIVCVTHDELVAKESDRIIRLEK